MNNTNRELNPEQVIQLFSKTLPHLIDGLGADRSWLWWSGEKPNEQDRASLKEIGFSFTPSPHQLEDGRVAHWYHSCGGAVFRRRGNTQGGGSSRQHSTPARKRAENKPARHSRVAEAETTQNSEAHENLLRIADLLPT